MVKFREASPGAAYEIAVGVVGAEEASKLGLAVVESTPDGRPSAYGRYKGAPDGGPLGITTAQPGDTEVVAGGGVSPGADSLGAAGQKGELLNSDDPFVHGGSGDDDSIHADGAAPGTVGPTDEQRTAAEEAARDSIEKATKHPKKK